MWLKHIFARAGDVAILTQQLSFQEERAKTAEWKCEQLEKEVKAERKRFDKVQSTFMDFVAKHTGTQAKFTAVQAEPVVVEPEQLTLYEENKIEWLAEQMRDADIEAGKEPYPFSTYLEAIQANPSYLQDIN